MTGDIRDNARLGLVHHMLYPSCMEDSDDHLRTLLKFVERDDIETFDCCLPYGSDRRRRLVPAIRDSGKEDITFATHLFPLRKLAPTTPAPHEQAQVRMIVSDMIEQAAAIGATGFIFASGGPAPSAATPADREAFAGFVCWLCAELKPHGITALLEPFDTTIDKKFLYGSTADCVALLDSLALETSNLGIELDLAHVPLMGESSEHAIRTVAPYLALGMYGRRAVPLARVRENDVLAIRQVLDMGAQGVIVPLVNSAEEAAQAVRAARYPPAGIRGYAFSRMNEWGREFDAYAAKANDAVAVVVMIESKEGAEHIDAILDVEGVDGVFIGPYDLSGSFNVPGQTEAAPVRKACRRVLDACANAGKSAGIHVVIPTPKAIASAIEDGFTFLALGVDTVFLGGGARDASAISKRRLIPVRIGPRCCARWP